MYIANILVSENRIEWHKHIVVSKKYVSIFDLKTKTLAIELRKDYENKIGKNKNITGYNTDNKGHLFVTFFAICSCYRDRLVMPIPRPRQCFL